jgi:hypothetical protein
MLISRRARGVVVEHPLTVVGDVVVFFQLGEKSWAVYIELEEASKLGCFSYVFYSSVALSISEIYYS